MNQYQLFNQPLEHPYKMMFALVIGMLDPIIISYKLTIYLCVTYLEYNNIL